MGDGEHHLESEDEPIGQETAAESVDTAAPREPVPRSVRSVKRVLQVGSDLLRLLTDQERQAHGDRLREMLFDILKGRLKDLPENIRMEMESWLEGLSEDTGLQEALDKAIGEIQRHSDENYKKRRDAKPRWRERDAEIVRLRDEERHAFSKIPRKLKAKNSRWGNPNGGLLSVDAVEAAYRREIARRCKRS